MKNSEIEKIENLSTVKRCWRKIKSLFCKFKKNKKQLEQISADDIPHIFSEAKEMKAGEIMIPRTDIIAVDVSVSIEKLCEKFIDTGFIRLIVCKKDLDEIVGVINLRDCFKYFYSTTNGDKKENFSLSNIMQRAIYAARSTRCLSLLNKMQSENASVAVILDEYGGTEGIIVMEKLIEKILKTPAKDIEYEKNVQPAIQKIGKSSYIVDARTSIQDFEAILEDSGFLSEEEGTYETIGGFVLSYLDRIPVKGEKFTHPGGIDVEVMEATNRMVKSVKITMVNK